MSSWNDRWRGAYSEHNPFVGFNKCEICGEVRDIGDVKRVHLIGEEIATCPECYKVVSDFENELEERIHPPPEPPPNRTLREGQQPPRPKSRPQKVG